MSSERPRFKLTYHIESIRDIGIVLLSDTEQIILSGRLYALVTPLIDGVRSADEIVTELAGEASAVEVYYALESLGRQGYITEADYTEADRGMPAAATAFWQSMDVPPRAVSERLEASSVRVISTCEHSPDPIREALARLGLGESADPDADPDLDIVIADDYLNPELAAINGQALADSQPWLLIKPVGTTVWIGPLFQPGKTGCWQCLAQRLRINSPLESFVRGYRPGHPPYKPVQAALSCTVALAANMAALEVVKWLGGERSSVTGSILALDTLSLSATCHHLVRRPQCPGCGDPECLRTRQARPIELRSALQSTGEHRLPSVDETLKRYWHHVSPITGTVRELRPLHGADNGLCYVYASNHSRSVDVDSLTSLDRALRISSGGKGQSDSQAKVSGLCEALERYSGVFCGEELVVQATYVELGDKAIHPNDCMLFSDRQYANRDRLNEANRGHLVPAIPSVFIADELQAWAPLWSLTEATVKYLPASYCYYQYPRKNPPTSVADSNGCAAGSSLEDAILHGFFELVERDSVALWWYNRVRRPGVDLESFGEPYFHRLKRYLDACGRDLWVLDMTGDLGIPAFAAVSARQRTAASDEILLGFGAHFDPSIAILHALNELTQFLIPWDCCKPPENRHLLFDSATRLWLETASLEQQRYFIPDPGTALRRAADYPCLSSPDLRDEVQNCVDIAARHGLETLVLDQTRPDIGLPVVRVVVPGLRHMYARFARGRLFDVPVRLGWLERPLEEDELNPTAVFL